MSVGCGPTSRAKPAALRRTLGWPQPGHDRRGQDGTGPQSPDPDRVRWVKGPRSGSDAVAPYNVHELLSRPFSGHGEPGSAGHGRKHCRLQVPHFTMLCRYIALYLFFRRFTWKVLSAANCSHLEPVRIRVLQRQGLAVGPFPAKHTEGIASAMMWLIEEKNESMCQKSKELQLLGMYLVQKDVRTRNRRENFSRS